VIEKKFVQNRSNKIRKDVTIYKPQTRV